MKLSVLVPVYNGAPYLQRCLDQLMSLLSAKGEPSEVIVCEDGSTDGTKQLCIALMQRYPAVRFLREDQRLGRGRALSRSIQAASGDILVYVDVDMATDARFIEDLVAAVRNGADVATGSRYLPQSVAHRRLGRYLLSRTYNEITRLLFRSRLRDHQCGFKAFKRSALEQVLPRVKSNHWFWDTELLIRAQLLGLRVDEVPIHWSETEAGTTLELGRDVLDFLKELVRLRLELSMNPSSAVHGEHPAS